MTFEALLLFIDATRKINKDARRCKFIYDCQFKSLRKQDHQLVEFLDTEFEILW